MRFQKTAACIGVLCLCAALLLPVSAQVAEWSGWTAGGSAEKAMPATQRVQLVIGERDMTDTADASDIAANTENAADTENGKEADGAVPGAKMQSGSETRTITTTVPDTHKVRLTVGDHGSVRIGGREYRGDATADVERLAEQTYTVVPDSGWKVDTVTYGQPGAEETVELTGLSYTAPPLYRDGNVLTVTFERSSSGSGGAGSGGPGGGTVTYTVTVGDSENGRVETDPDDAPAGSGVTLTVTPDEGYELSSLTVTDAGGNEIPLTEADGTYRFTMPSSKVTVTAEFTAAGETPGTPEIPGTAEVPFADVSSADWYYEAVAYAYENGLMNGISDTQFDPDGTTTRGMMATILYRLEGDPAAPACGFDDVAADRYYTDAVAWAAENDLVNGYGDQRFGPEDHVTREQMTSLLHRYAEYKDYDVTAEGDLSGYNDADRISGYAVTAMQWAASEGLVNGMGDGTLAPQGESTRAQIAAILMRFLENVISE